MKRRFEIITKFVLSILTCLVVVSIFFALYGLFQISVLDRGYASYFGYGLFEVESGSMAPTIDVKDMVIVRETDKIKKNDIITYELDGNFITHRVVDIKDKKVVAKGDYNNFEDKTIPKKSIIGKVVKIIPKFGIWKEIILSPIVLIAIFFTLLLFGLGFSYEDKKLAAKKRLGYTFKNELLEDDEKKNTKFKKFLKVLRVKLLKSNDKVSHIKSLLDEKSSKDSVVVKAVEEDNNALKKPDSEKRELVNISGKCKWVDDNNRDGKRPNSLVVKLMNKDKIVESKEINSNNGEFVFDNLYKYEENHENEKGFEIEYKIDSVMIPGYKKEIQGYDVVNTHSLKKINISGEIFWIDDNNENNVRPKSVIINLMKNNTILDVKKISKDNKWKYTFIDLYKYENGKEIEYVIDEENIKNYNKEISGYNITNRYTSSKK